MHNPEMPYPHFGKGPEITKAPERKALGLKICIEGLLTAVLL